MLESAILGFLAGVVGGVVTSGLRLLHLEMEWHQVRRDLRRYYAQGRADRAREIEPRAAAGSALTPDQIMEIARKHGLAMNSDART